MSNNMEYAKDLSIVISLFNEEESLPELVSWIESVMNKEGYSYEILMIDDGSKDASSRNFLKRTLQSEEFHSDETTVSLLHYTMVSRLQKAGL